MMKAVIAQDYAVAEAPKRARVWSHLYVQVLVAIALGAIIGHFWPSFGESLKPIGDAFIKLVKMIIAPVIFLTVVTGIAGMREGMHFSRVFLVDPAGVRKVRPPHRRPLHAHLPPALLRRLRSCPPRC